MGSNVLSLALTVASGVLWTITYIEGIRLGFRDKTYAMPLWALALNFAWEILNSVLGYQEVGLGAQVIINIVWAIFDALIVITYFRYGYRYVQNRIGYRYFVLGSLLVFLAAAVVEQEFIREFGLSFGRAYAAFLQNLLMSVLFVVMFFARAGREGQSLTIAVCKCLGTLAPTVLFGVMGEGGLKPNEFLLIIGLLCFLCDLAYIGLVGNLFGLAASVYAEAGALTPASSRGAEPLPDRG